MIRRCTDHDIQEIWTIINDAAIAYKGVIPEDRWSEPYMTKEQLQHEMQSGVAFWGCDECGLLLGIMGLQQKADLALIRHAYVRTSSQKQGTGAQLLVHLLSLVQSPVLVGTWADAQWAIRFYRKYGFEQVSTSEKERLLGIYWSIPERQVETSVVLKWERPMDADPPSTSIPYSIP